MSTRGDFAFSEREREGADSDERKWLAKKESKNSVRGNAHGSIVRTQNREEFGRQTVRGSWSQNQVWLSSEMTIQRGDRRREGRKGRVLSRECPSPVMKLCREHGWEDQGRQNYRGRRRPWMRVTDELQGQINLRDSILKLKHDLGKESGRGSGVFLPMQ